MSEINLEEHPELHPITPVVVPDLGAPSLPSSRSYESWAVSCPTIFKEFHLGGEVSYMRAKLCTFCRIAVSCPTSDGSLVEHMKSTACKLVQEDLKAEIRHITEGNWEVRESETTSSPISYGSQSE
ncbi:hypothetical protein FRC06_007981 [Ceratobasidium sp. 370]|nr:hypothetical protein FRC06_007981 [Ceratobasidium sp. 370]